MRRSIVAATALVATVGVAVGFIAALIVTNHARSEAAVELRRQALVAARVIEEDLERREFRPGRDAATQLARYREQLARSLERVRVVGGHDIVEAVLTVRDRDVVVNGPLRTPALIEGGAARGVEAADVDGERMLVAIEQIDTSAGSITVALATTQPSLPSQLVMWTLLAAVGAGAALSVALGWWFVRRISRRLEAVGAAAHAFGEGDLEVRASVDGDDEIADLARGFNSMAERLDAARGREKEFLLSIGHDLRTPLTTIRGYAEALDGGLVADADLPMVAASLNRQTDRLSRLVDDLTLIARIDTAVFTLHPEVHDAGAAVAELAATYRDPLAAKGIELDVMTSPVWLDVDADRLVQVVGNLLDNALRYTPSGGSVVVQMVETPTGARVSVMNTDALLDARDLPHLFDRHFVGDRAPGTATGLGLAIVKELTEAMGGTVSVEVTDTNDAVFTIDVAGRAVTPA